MLEAISFKEYDIMTMRLLLGGTNQTAIRSKEHSMYMCANYSEKNKGRERQRGKGKRKERERERLNTSSVMPVPVHPWLHW